MPLAPAIFDQFVIDLGSIGQEHVGKRPSVLVKPVGLKGDCLAKGECRGSPLGSPAEGLAFLGKVNPAEADS